MKECYLRYSIYKISTHFSHIFTETIVGSIKTHQNTSAGKYQTAADNIKLEFILARVQTCHDKLHDTAAAAARNSSISSMQ